MTSIQTNTSQCSLTQEEINFLRTANLILRVAPPAVRLKFDKEFDPVALQHTLNKARCKDLEPLKKRKVINLSQWNFMFPVSGKASSTTFDLTLMICLIRNLTQISVADILPSPQDTSEGADLSRLKYYRNKIAHCDDGVLTDSQLNDYWNDISQAIVRLGGNRFKQKCDDLKICKLDNNDREIITEIRNMEKSHDPIPRGLKGIHTEVVEEWKKQKVVETRAVKQLFYLTKKADTVVAVGSSGCGKSTSIQYVALMLHHQLEFDIIPVPSPDLMLQYFNPDHRQVFVINDICGKSTIDMNLVNRWSSLSLEITKMLKCKTVKILSSCRTHIYQDRLFKNINFMSTEVCNLTSEFCLTKTERLLIAEMYLTNDEVKKIQVNIFEMYDFFPLLCNLFAKQTGKDVVAFFSNPVQIITEDLQLLFNSSDQTTFATLFLFIAYNNNLHENLFAEKSGIKQVLSELFDNFQLQSNLSFQVIKYEIVKLCEAYLKKSADTYSILHEKLFTIFVSFCGEQKFDLVLNIGHTEVVRDRFLLKRLMTGKMDITEHFITIPETKETQYFERLLRDINDGFLENIFLNTQLKYESFRQQLIKFLLDSVDIHKTVNSLDNYTLSTLLMLMARQGFSDMLTLLLSEHVAVNCNTGTDGSFDTSLYEASSEGFVDTVEILLEHKANPDFIFENLKTSLYVASENGYSDIVRLLLYHKANPNIKSIGKLTPLYVAALNGDAAIVKLLLLYNADPNIGSWGDVTPLFEAAKGGFIDVVKLLLEYKANPNLSDKYSRIPLDIASEKGYTDIVTLLLKYKSETDHRDEDNVTPLLRALMANHTDTAKELLKDGADYNICNIINISPFFVAVEKNNTEIVSMMLQYGAGGKIKNRYNAIRFYLACKRNELIAGNSSLEKQVLLNSTDYEFNQSALHVTSCLGHTDIVKMLLNKKCDINIRDKYGATPLLRSSFSGRTDTVKLLLDHEASVNTTDIFGDTAVLVATMKGQVEIVRLLLKYKCDANIRNRRNETPLHLASSAGYTELVKLLLEHTNDIEMYNTDHETPLYDEKHETPLFYASSKGHVEIVKLLLEHNSDCNIFNMKHETPLFIAVSNDHLEVVKVLLNQNTCNTDISNKDNTTKAESLSSEQICDTNIVNEEHETPLFRATFNGNVEMVKLLLARNSSANISNNKNETPLCISSCNGHYDVVQVLAERKFDLNLCNDKQETPLFQALRQGHTEIAKLLLQNNCDANICNKFNVSPLCYAARNGDIQIVQLLLNHHMCKIEVSDVTCATLLYTASYQNHTDIVAMILKYNTEHNIRLSMTTYSWVLYAAVFNDNADIVKMLLENNCDYYKCNMYLKNPLFMASEIGSIKIVNLLLIHNFDPNICNTDNETPLFRASFEGFSEIAKLLLENNCDPNLSNKYNQSPLHVASIRGHTNIVILLLLYNCNSCLRNQHNESALDIASALNHTEIMLLLIPEKNRIVREKKKKCEIS